jgi:two-component system, chemotaxis family, chemotaxis protein CheV
MKENVVLFESEANIQEIIEFGVANSKFGISVIKVREIINPLPVVAIPNSHTSIEGIIEIRGEIMPVVNIAKVLGYPESTQPQMDKYIVTEFNKQKMVLHVHGVDKIHRISREEIEEPSNLYQGSDSQIIGVIRKENDMILFLDFEKILVDINLSDRIPSRGR